MEEKQDCDVDAQGSSERSNLGRAERCDGRQKDHAPYESNLYLASAEADVGEIQIEEVRYRRSEGQGAACGKPLQLAHPKHTDTHDAENPGVEDELFARSSL
jgi:hypothetical protein